MSTRAPIIQNLTPAALGVLLLAVCSVLFIVAQLPSGYGARVGQWQIAVPHLAVIACLAFGNRRSGDALAILVGIPFGVLAWLVYSLSGLGDNHKDGPIGMAFALLQLLMILFAAHDSKQNATVHSKPIKPRQRLIGLALPFALLVLAFSVNQHFLNSARR
ncbi:MAG: hypothetical protein ACJ8AK_16670 [Gemmatimonadaceae bacterium]